MQFDTVVANGNVVLPKEGIVRANVGIVDGKVAALLEPSLSVQSRETIDARGKYILPGAIDPHTHLGFGNPETDFLTETQAAAIGGVTTVLSFMLKPEPYDKEFQTSKQRGEAQAYVDFGLHGTAVIDQHLADLDHYIRDFGITSYKFFMSFRGEEGAYIGLSGIDDGFMYEFFEALGRRPGTVACVHPENIEVVWRLRKRLADSGRDDLSAWYDSRPPFVEAEASVRAIYLAGRAGCPVYLVHMSSKEALDAAVWARERNPSVYIETCPHYLTHTTDSPLGTLGKQNPPLRKQVDVDALWEGIARGAVDAIGSDHAPRKRAKKQGTIWTSSPGMPSLPILLPVMLSEGANRRGLSLQRVAEVTSYNPARIFNLYPRKGTLRAGADADLVIVDLGLERTVHAADLRSHADFSIYEGQTLRGWPVLTMVRGKVVMRDGQIVGPQGHGKYIPRN